MIHSCAMRVLLTGGLFCLVCLAPVGAAAQRGATGPVAQLNAEAKALSETDPARLLSLAQQAQATARAAKDLRGEAEALNLIAYAYRNQSQLELARKHATESSRLFAQAGDDYGEAQGLNTLGLVYFVMNDFANALAAFQRGLAIRERADDMHAIAVPLNSIGLVEAQTQPLKRLWPICASCKKIRDDNGYWTQVEAYVSAHSSAEFTHSICPSCFDGLHPDHHHHEQPPS